MRRVRQRLAIGDNEAHWSDFAAIEDAVRFADFRAHHHTATENGALDDDAADR